jgi:flagellar biosynthetic protein FlhB
MADEEEKTEEPTSKKIEDARKKGNVPKSQDVSGFITLFIAVAAIMMLLPFMLEHVINLFKYYLSLQGTPIDKHFLMDVAIITFKEVLIIIMPVSITVAIAGVLAAIGQFGFLFTVDAIQPKFDKLDPIKGMKNLFGIKKMVDGFKVTAKSFITLGVGAIYFIDFITELPTVALFSLADQFTWLGEKILIIVSVMLFIIFLFAFIDLMITRKRYTDGLKMTKQEIKDEHKNAEGDPLIKGKIRQKQMEMTRQRMMSNVPDADVVITNPTHYAVALKYDDSKHAPIVVAKGMDTIAQKIKEIARENNVHIVQNPPLARSLYAEVEVEEAIPESLFAAVAEILAYVYKINGK